MKMFAKFDKAIHNTGNKGALNLAAGRRTILPGTTLQLQVVLRKVKRIRHLLLYKSFTDADPVIVMYMSL
jgi:hypothetical protein